MDVQTEPTIAASSSALSLEKVRFNQAEDSGYHTFTPGSFESSELSCDIVDHCGKLVTTITGQIQIVTPDLIQLRRRYRGSISSTTTNSPLHTPPIRRALKRPYCSTENADFHINSVPTPTSYIAGKIQSLHVNDKIEFNKTTPENVNNQLSDCAQISEYPTTPVKRNCKVPCKRSAKKLDFTTHSLLCETSGLQLNNKSNKKQYKKLRIQSKARTNLFKSDPKIDIISRLYQECGTGPPIMKILNFISFEDILNFNLVSRYWKDIWEDVSEENILKQRYREYLRISKENLENKDKGVTPKKNKKESTILKDIQNDLKDKVANMQGFSPPNTPRTNRFKKFTKVTYYLIYERLLQSFFISLFDN